jgi:hypothetical protein
MKFKLYKLTSQNQIISQIEITNTLEFESI